MFWSGFWLGVSVMVMLDAFCFLIKQIVETRAARLADKKDAEKWRSTR